MTFDIVQKDPHSRARSGRFRSGKDQTVETPSYVVVGTNGYIRTLEPEDIPGTKTQMVIANTYHLWRELGDEGLESYPGLHEAMEWREGLIMTDSGGFQVFSLGFLREQGMRYGGKLGGDAPRGENMVRITESGVYFKDPSFGGSDEEQYLDAELSIKIQEQLGADIIVAFDEPTSPAHDYEYVKQAMRRTHKWAERSLDAKESNQAIYGVVQGAAFEDLRTESARFIGSLPFDGFAIGGTYGEGYGGSREQTEQAIRWAIANLPEGKPRHLFGVGRIEDLFIGVEQGIDTFDCVIPTREARHGALWTQSGRLDIGGKGKYADDGNLIAPDCTCPVCSGGEVTRRDLHKLFKDKNPDAGRLATIHNMYFFNDLMEHIRDSIRDGQFQEFKKTYLKSQ